MVLKNKKRGAYLLKIFLGLGEKTVFFWEKLFFIWVFSSRVCGKIFFLFFSFPTGGGQTGFKWYFWEKFKGKKKN